MPKKFWFLEDVAIADIAFEAEGNSVEELFENCGKALSEVMVDRRKLKAERSLEFEKTSGSLEGLLYEFLEELVYLKDVSGLVFKNFKVSFFGQEKLKVICEGSYLSNLPKEVLRNDVKAITLHMFSVKKKGNKFVARVVLDI